MSSFSFDVTYATPSAGGSIFQAAGPPGATTGGEVPGAILGGLASETKTFLDRAASRRFSNPLVIDTDTSSGAAAAPKENPRRLESQDSSRRGHSLARSMSKPIVTSAIKQKFTVTEEILKQIKMNNFKQAQARAAWSPTWQRSTAAYAPMDTESLVNSYVELVCDDLKTNEKKRIHAEEGAKWVIDPGATWRMRW